MFDILVYLYETYYRPDACPEPVALAQKLSDVGFEEDDISDALDWLNDLSTMTQDSRALEAAPDEASTGLRFYISEELDELGMAAIGFIQFLESAKVINSLQREIVIERALAVNESPISLGKLKVIVLMMLWSQGKEPDALMFDDLFSIDEEATPRLLH
jgi:Smg protein